MLSSTWALKISTTSSLFQYCLGYNNIILKIYIFYEFSCKTTGLCFMKNKRLVEYDSFPFLGQKFNLSKVTSLNKRSDRIMARQKVSMGGEIFV